MSAFTSLHPHTSRGQQVSVYIGRAWGRYVDFVVAHDDVPEQGYDSG